jgi:predicted RNase H-like nuclease (RuvC/YqgF family)
MFDDKFFEQWLDNQAQKVMEQVANGQSISPEQMMVLVLKAQTNHFAHLDIELREDIQALDRRLSGEMQSMNERLGKEMQSMNERLGKEMQDLRKDMDKRFEQVDKRFEQVDKRFEQVDKRFEMLVSRIDHFMIWSFATSFTMAGLVVAAIKLLP